MDLENLLLAQLFHQSPSFLYSIIFIDQMGCSLRIVPYQEYVTYEEFEKKMYQEAQ